LGLGKVTCPEVYLVPVIVQWSAMGYNADKRCIVLKVGPPKISITPESIRKCFYIDVPPTASVNPSYHAHKFETRSTTQRMLPIF